MSTVELALRVFIVDDEPPARNRLRDLLGDCREQLALDIVGEAGNGHEALEALVNAPTDVVLLDIRMPQMDGIELAQHLLRFPKPPVVIFTTAFDDYAIKAFELHAIDYLLKPIRLGRLFEALNRARDAVPIQTEVLCDLLPEPRKNFSVREHGKIFLIPLEDVLYLRAEQKYVAAHTNTGREYLLDEPLTALEKEFSERFSRIHRNCLVAKDAVEGFEKGGEDSESSGWMVRLKGLKESLAISRRQQHIIKEFS